MLYITSFVILTNELYLHDDSILDVNALKKNPNRKLNKYAGRMGVFKEEKRRGISKDKFLKLV